MKINWDSEVLSSVSKVVDQLEHLSINKDSIESVANWLAYEEFPMPSSAAVRNDADDFIRATMFMNTLNFAFTDFDKSIKYEVNKDGKILSDSEAMYFQVNNAISSGIQLTDGNEMASISLQQLKNIFLGNIEMPMLKERVEILNEVGQKLVDSYEGDWLNFIKNGPQKLYSNGEESELRGNASKVGNQVGVLLNFRDLFFFCSHSQLVLLLHISKQNVSQFLHLNLFLSFFHS